MAVEVHSGVSVHVGIGVDGSVGESLGCADGDGVDVQTGVCVRVGDRAARVAGSVPRVSRGKAVVKVGVPVGTTPTLTVPQAMDSASGTMTSGTRCFQMLVAFIELPPLLL